MGQTKKEAPCSAQELKGVISVHELGYQLLLGNLPPPGPTVDDPGFTYAENNQEIQCNTPLCRVTWSVAFGVLTPFWRYAGESEHRVPTGNNPLPEGLKTVATRPQRQNHTHGWRIQKLWKLKQWLNKRTANTSLTLNKISLILQPKPQGFGADQCKRRKTSSAGFSLKWLFSVANFCGRCVHSVAKWDYLHVTEQSSKTKPSSLIFLCKSVL